MKRFKKARRLTAMMLMLVMALSLLTGCKRGESGGNGGNGEGGTEKGGTEAVDDLGAVWTTRAVTGLELLEGSSGGVMDICVYDGSYYVFAMNYDNPEMTGVYRIGTDGTVQDEISLPLPKDSYPGFFTMDSEGNFYYTVTAWTSDEESVTQIVKADPSGSEIWNVPIGADGQNYFSIYGGTVSDQAGLLVRTDLGLEVYSLEDGSQVKVIDPGSDAAGSVCRLSDGTVLLSGWDEMGSLSINRVDFESGEVSKFTLPEGTENQMASEELTAGPGGSILFPGEGAIYCADPASGRVFMYLDYLQSDMDTTQASNLAVMSADQMLCACYTAEGMQELLLLDRADPAAMGDKTTLTLGCMYMEDSVRRQIIAFNRSSDKYHIEVRDYSAGGSDDNYVETMNNDIITGNVPDILLVGYGLPMDSYIAKGIFEPLDSYLDGDNGIRREDYLENVLDIGRVQGQLYTLAPSFYVNALAGKKSVLGDVKGLTVEEIRNYIKRDNIPVTTAFGAYVTQNDLLVSALNSNIADYVDKDTGKCSFSSQGFIDLLEITAELPAEASFMEDEESEEMETLMRDGKALLTTAWLYNFRAFSEMEQSTLGEPAVYVGYPSENRTGPSIETNLQLAMSASSEHKEAVWEFLRSFLTEEYQDTVEFGFPVYRKSLDKLAAAAQERPYYTNENGEKEYYDDTYYLNGQEIIVKPLTQEQTAEIIDFLSSVTNRADLDINILNIVNEETGAFYSGQKSAKDVADTIQSRVQIYLNESR